MRQIVLDTETTGMSPQQGHRIIEVGCIELDSRHPTGRTLHHYINPERDIDLGAQEVHGLSREFLEDKPVFAEIAAELRDFIAGAELVIHNAPFDVGFLDMEFGRLRQSPVDELCGGVLDTLKLARDLHPGKRNNLDALCERYQISNAHRTLHGALLDAELLADVYLAMTRGQESLLTEASQGRNRRQQGLLDGRPEVAARRARLRVQAVSPEEEARHQAILAAIQKESKGRCRWMAAGDN